MRIKEYRIKAGLTQEELGNICEVPLSTIKNWERGTRKCPAYVEEFIIEKLQKIIEKNENQTLLKVIKNAHKIYNGTGINLSVFIFPHYEIGTWKENMPIKLIFAEYDPFDKKVAPLAFNEYGRGKSPIYRVISSDHIKHQFEHAMHSNEVDRIKKLNNIKVLDLLDEYVECDYSKEELEELSWKNVELEMLKIIGTIVIEHICPNERLTIPKKIQLYNNENEIIYPFSEIITMQD